MSDLIKTSFSLENCSFHPRGERSWAGLGLQNDLALKAQVFPTWFGAKRPSPAVRWVPSGYLQLAEEPRARFLGIHHFRPLWSRHFIIGDHSAKQHDAAHFYLSRFTKPPFSRLRSNKSLGAGHQPLASRNAPPRAKEARRAEESRRRARAPRRPRAHGFPGPRAPRWRVPGCGPGGTRLPQSCTRLGLRPPRDASAFLLP